MGAWGTGPFDNDSAADVLGDLNSEHIAPLVGRLLANNGEFGPSLYDVRVAVWLMTRLWVSPYTSPPAEVAEPLMRRGVEALSRYMADEDDEWADAMRAERDHLLSVMRGDECPPGLLDRIAEVLS